MTEQAAVGSHCGTHGETLLLLEHLRQSVDSNTEGTEMLINDHEHRLRALETTVSGTLAKMDAVCDRLGSLVGWIKAVSLLLLSTLIGIATLAIK